MLGVEDTWGVASLRQCSGFPVSEYEYQAPLGCSIATWNIKTKERSLFQAHDDLITVMRKSKSDIVLTCSYHGQVKIWNNTYNLLASLKIPSEYIVEGTWSTDGEYFSICTKGPDQMIVVYELNSVLGGSTTCKWFRNAPQKEPVKEGSYDCFNATLFREDLNILAVYQSAKTCEIFEFSNNGDLIKTANVSPLDDETNIMLCISTIRDNMFAIGLQNGVFGFYDVNTLEMKLVTHIAGSPQVCLWNEAEFVAVAYMNGIMTWWDNKGELLREVKGLPNGSIVHMDISKVSTTSYWIGGIMSLHYLSLSDDHTVINECIDLSFLKLTGCGISVSDDNTVATGDFTGAVMTWKHGLALPQRTCNTGTQVRCLQWYKDVLFIGNLNGELYSLSASTSSEVDEVYNFIGGIVILKMSNDMNYLAAGTTAGYLYVFNISLKESKAMLDLVYHGVQHQPKKSADGTMVAMEIWSLAWKPDDKLLVTTSEDYTSAIADPTTGIIKTVLRGHTTAVTSSDWKIISTNLCLLITCADDKTARIYDGESFNLLKVVNTYNIYGWHTLTYMCIDSIRDLLICSTQNGYLSMWNLKTFENVYEEKLHGGSIEGLVVDNHKVHTVGSDCVVNTFKFK